MHKIWRYVMLPLYNIILVITYMTFYYYITTTCYNGCMMPCTYMMFNKITTVVHDRTHVYIHVITTTGL